MNARLHRVAHLLVALNLAGYSAFAHGQENDPKQPEAPEQQSAGQLPKGALLRIGKYGAGAGFYGIYHLAFSPDGRLLATRSSDQFVRVFDAGSGKQLSEIDGHEGSVQGVIFAPDGQTIITTSPGTDEAIKFWDAKTGKARSSIEGGGSILRLTDGGETLKVVDARQWRAYRTEDGSRIAADSWSYAGSELAVALSDDGTKLATYSYRHGKQGRHFIAVRDIGTGAQTALTGLTAAPTMGRFSPDGKRFLVCCHRANHALLWHLDQARQPRSIAHAGPVQAVAFSQDGRFVATGSWDTSVILWEVITGRPVVTLQGHSEHVCSVAFSPDGRRFASGASGRTDNSAVVWDLPQVIFGEPSADALDDDKLAALWEQLGQDDPVEAYPALGKLVAGPDKALAFFIRHIDEVASGANQDRVKQLILELDDEQFDVRESAHRELLKLRAIADLVLRKTLSETTSAEVRYRISRILETPFDKAVIGDQDLRRTHRMIYALEMMGGKAAAAQLARLAAGHPHVDVMRDADAAVQRIKGKQQD